MCAGYFAESITKEIRLPEDNADSFGRLLEHLYGNNSAAFDINYEDSGVADKLVDMYTLAEKYQLADLQNRIEKSLEQLNGLSQDRLFFFKIAHKICQSAVNGEKIFNTELAVQARKRLKDMTVEESKELSELVELGGSYASKIFSYQAAAHAQDKAAWLSEKKALSDKFKKAVEQAATGWSSSILTHSGTTYSLEKAKRMHASQHPHCEQCHVLL